MESSIFTSFDDSLGENNNNDLKLAEKITLISIFEEIIII